MSPLHQPSDDLRQFDDDDGNRDGGEEDEGGGEEEEDELEEGGVEERVDAEGEMVRVPRGSPPLPSNHHKVLRLHIWHSPTRSASHPQTNVQPSISNLEQSKK